MFKKVIFASGVAAMIAVSAHAQESKFVFRYVSGGGAGLVSSKPVEPEPEAPETTFDTESVFVEDLEAYYNLTGDEIGSGDSVVYSFYVANRNGKAIDSANVVIGAAAIATPIIITTPECGKTQIAANSRKMCSGYLNLSDEIIESIINENSVVVIQTGISSATVDKKIVTGEFLEAVASKHVSAP